MAADEQDSTPSLEPPKLFGRRRRGPDADEPAREPQVEAVFTDVGTDASPVESAPVATPVAAPSPALGTSTDAPRAARRPLRLPPGLVQRLPRPGSGVVVPSYALAAAAGLVTGIGLLALVWLGFRGCEAITGAVSCGTGPGMVALVVVFLVAVLLGRLLLGLLKLPEAGMTSFLAVGLTSLVVVLSPEGLLDSAAILVLLPLLTAATFAASSWVATLQLDPDA